ncbi:GNAT family N-acetyltransferase [Dethiosulfovibrio salsuginis]|uniref:Ribosomal protein S18 acetylase RimI n=1 Tax=Dethiosulfovibrio salsuginis TaxID=561720 RepID=A0A1X7K6G0_9BACT|nr:GNAT family N-acetyltransferase [Dethiosulfovibrio salsuginis]SMG36239.1 Ribosomal protein S18 acetylase RimI [Dethiosulfovibrio salsuginis]
MILVDIDFCDEGRAREIAAIDLLSQPAPWPLEAILKDMRERQGEVVYLGAFYKSGMVGFVALEPRAEDLWVLQLSVDPERRRWGVGSQLIGAASVFADERGCSRIFLSVRASNRGALEFYRALGFRQREVLINYYSNGEDGIRMFLELW